MLTSSDEVSGYNTDWLRTVRGQTRCVLRPRDTLEVSFSLRKSTTSLFFVTFPLAINKIFKIIHLHSRCPHYWHTVGLEVLQFVPRCFSKLPNTSLKSLTLKHLLRPNHINQLIPREVTLVSWEAAFLYLMRSVWRMVICFVKMEF